MSDAARARAWRAVETVQTSSMDCGPACLSTLLQGFGLRASYGRLREACQTDVDGTSIDAIEQVANALGLHAEQRLVPTEHLLLAGEPNLPALVVVRQSDGPLHFVVLWRRVGAWLQVMDPAVGRRWVRSEAFLAEVAQHQASVPAADWRAFATSDEGVRPLRTRLAALGADASAIEPLVAQMRADAGWFTAAALDASIRLATQVVRAKGLRRGRDAEGLVRALLTQTLANPDHIFAVVPRDYWRVTPDIANTDTSHQRLSVSGCVVLSVSRRDQAHTALDAAPALSPELMAAAAEAPVHPLRTLWTYVREDGVLSPMLLVGVIGLATTTTLLEGLLFRGLFDLGSRLALGSQRLYASLALLAFLAVTFALRLPIVRESMRLGRTLDARLRMALLDKLPRLGDRYFQSRPLSDLADRSHSIHQLRMVPGMAVHFLQTVGELGLTLAGVIALDPAGAPLALAIAALAAFVPAATQPLIAERDLRARNQNGALSRFYLDALLGLVPVRAHGADAAIRRQHERLLVEWVRASRRTLRASVLGSGVQALACTALCAVLLLRHFARANGVNAADLLLVYWTLKLPTLGQTLTALAQQYPVQRNILLRLLEPLSAPEHRSSTSSSGAAATPTHLAVTTEHIVVEDGCVMAAGHPILRDVNLRIAHGEHVAIVGVSGAGKSSLLGLLLGWHRLSSGRLRVDGREVDEGTLDTIRRQTAWVDPGVQLFNRSLLDNLQYSSEQPDVARTTRALDTARLRSVLRGLPQGLQTPLGEGGALVSGGEGQRIRLARALAQTGVTLALLDEPFRGLDRAQRASLMDDVRQHWSDATLLCVTHDVTETQGFDRVLVIEHGAIVEDGDPRRLATTRSRYRELLQAEARVRDRMWQAPFWRRLRVQDGTVVEPRTASAARPQESRA